MGGRTDGLGGLLDGMLRMKVAALEKKFAATRFDDIGSLEAAAGKLKFEGQLRRSEVAAHLGVSTKKIQRMEAAGTLVRCPNLGSVVRYASRDVLRLASASRRREA